MTSCWLGIVAVFSHLLVGSLGDVRLYAQLHDRPRQHGKFQGARMLLTSKWLSESTGKPTEGMEAVRDSQTVPHRQHIHVGARIRTEPVAQMQARQSAYLAMCLVVKNQHDDIREWLLYHIGIGAGKFYIYDNNSTPPLRDTIADLIDQGLVHYSFMVVAPVRMRPQLYVYNTCLHKHGRGHTWMAFTDADEFLVLRNQSIPDMPTLLRQYEQFGGLVVNWQMFGSSGLTERAQQGVLPSYRKCFPWDHAENTHVKTIARIGRVKHTTGNPHNFVYRAGWFAVTETCEPSVGPRTPAVHIDQVALYHYVTKSLAEYQDKMQRGSAMLNHKSMEFFQHVEELATHECTDALLLG